MRRRRGSFALARRGLGLPPPQNRWVSRADRYLWQGLFAARGPGGARSPRGEGAGSACLGQGLCCIVGGAAVRRLRGEVSAGGSQASPAVETEPGVAGLGEDGTGLSEIPKIRPLGFCRRAQHCGKEDFAAGTCAACVASASWSAHGRPPATRLQDCPPS